MTIQLKSTEEICSDEETSEPVIKKKTRAKKVRDKWTSMFFAPMEVINSRKKVGGRLAPRNGLSMYRELICKSCNHLSHSRLAARVHSDTCHHFTKTNSPQQPCLKRNKSLQNASYPRTSDFATRLRTRLSHQKSQEIVTLDDEEEEETDHEKSIEVDFPLESSLGKKKNEEDEKNAEEEKKKEEERKKEDHCIMMRP